MELPIVDLDPYLRSSSSSSSSSIQNGGRENRCNSQIASPDHDDGDGDDAVLELCRRVSSALTDVGALVVRDPRVAAEDNERFLDMVERFFQMSDEFKREQQRPHLLYQVGVTPAGVELPRSAVDNDIKKMVSRLPEISRPCIPNGPDPKWRYMWRVGPRPPETQFHELNAESVIPEGFPEWAETMNSWGSKMIAAVEVVAEMAAIGFGLQPQAFTSLMYQGPHLLAPTGTNLEKDGQEGAILAGYHYDLNFLTIHGSCRFPGLSIWTKSGEKLEVEVPPGCLLLQTGKQFEWLTGGACTAGMHEVVVTKKTIGAIQSAVRNARCLWRVSSTVFGHIASDAVLQPLGHFASEPNAHKYPAVRAGDYVKSELDVIKLKWREK